MIERRRKKVGGVGDLIPQCEGEVSLCEPYRP